MKRLLVPENFFEHEAVEPELLHYVTHVLRAKVGDVFLLSNGKGSEAESRVLSIGAKKIDWAIGEIRNVSKPEGPKIVLIQALGKGDKMERIVRQSVELGAQKIVPVRTERSIPEHQSKRERWIAVAEDATRVSERAFRAEIDEVHELGEFLRKNPRAEQSIVCTKNAPASLLEKLREKPSAGHIELLVGPEGGFSAKELEDITRAGFEEAHLGRFNLRMDTAAPAAIALAVNRA